MTILDCLDTYIEHPVSMSVSSVYRGKLKILVLTIFHVIKRSDINKVLRSIFLELSEIPATNKDRTSIHTLSLISSIALGYIEK